MGILEYIFGALLERMLEKNRNKSLKEFQVKFWENVLMGSSEGSLKKKTLNEIQNK